jgi:hypothetical protein
MLNEPRVLPTARELAECHDEEGLKRVRGIAQSLGDAEAVTLFEAAIKEHRRLEVERSLARPADVREKMAHWRAEEERLRRLEVQGCWMPTSLAGALQSAGPSE